MRLYGLMGGQAHIHVQGMWENTCRGVWGHAPPPPEKILIFDLLLDAIWWNLGLFLHKHNLLCRVIKLTYM